MTAIPPRPDTDRHDFMGLTQPSEQRNWTDDNEWLEFGGCDVITRDHNFHVTGGVLLDREEDPEGESESEVSIAWFDLSDGESGSINMSPEEARKLAQRLIKAADEADDNASGRRATTTEIMEERRAHWHRRQARKTRDEARRAKHVASSGAFS